MDGDERPLLLSGRSWPNFVARTVTIEPGSSRAYDDGEWRDALVVVESGTVELETVAGVRLRFGPGEMLWLTGLALRSLSNVGAGTVVLQAVSRRPDEPG